MSSIVVPGWAILKAAIKQVPAVAYALAVAGIAVAASIIIKFVGNDQAAVIILAGVFTAMMLMFVFARMIVSPNPATTLPGLVLLYSVITFFTIFLVFTVTAFAAYWPPAWADFLGIRRPGCCIPIPPDPTAGVTSFKIMVSIGGSPPAERQWRRVTPYRWVEFYPTGNSTFFDYVSRENVSGCPGTKLKSESFPSHAAFVPDKGCPGMPFYINDNDKGWGWASSMSDVQ